MRMVSENNIENQNGIIEALEKAENMHGHLGPFLALGVRMSLAATRVLEAGEDNPQLHASARLEYKVPFSCMLDGIQVVTKCTVGNKRLSWKESKKFSVLFTLKDEGRQVTVTAKPDLIAELKHKLKEKPSDAVVRQLAFDIANRPETRLFTITSSQDSRPLPRDKSESAKDIELAKSALKKNKANLVIVKNGKLLFATDVSGIRGLLGAIEKIGNELKGSTAADKVVGEAAAQLFVYSNMKSVFATTLSQCGKDLLKKNNISYSYESLVPHILNFDKTDLCPFEKAVAGARSPAEAYEQLKKSAFAMQSRHK